MARRGEQMVMAQYVLTGMILLLCTYTDIRQRKVYKSIVVLHLILAVGLHAWMRELLSLRVAVGIFPGIISLLLAMVTNQAMGYGDAALILSCGFSLGFDRELSLLLIAFSGAGLWALLLLAFRRGKKDSEIPFVPFLLAGTIIQGLGEWLL